ncbi:thioesterase [Actinophytocola xinjiangensis]|uniref:Thioesterase n=1 Tax=Actinophytocola xinjiangensis TaxID=485602 RepID=A0A7Z0WLH6_9PSEU|nr:thioesterase domain-containing protein [Actinophytocola xinjiangensis]OLF09659.1 thioesterase [Actinophytocola xinjiangensis]
MSTRDRTFLRPVRDDCAARLFCFPYSGLGASMYNRWPRRVADDGADIEVCLLQPPGRENRLREPHFGTYENLAEQVSDSLEPHLDRPYGLFGHCGGALAAFATAALIAGTGLPDPTCVFVSSQVAPHLGPYGRYLSMTESALTAELEGLTRVMGGEPQPDIIALGLRVMRTDLDANRAYRLDEPVVLPGDLRVIGWRDDHEIRPEQMTGWAAYAAPGRFHEVVLPGTHHEFLTAPTALRREFAAGLAHSGKA